MRSVLILLLAMALSFFILPARADSSSGSWTAEIVEDQIRLVLHRDDRHGSTSGRSHALSRFTGLPDVSFDGQTEFSLASEAGGILFEGSFRNGRGIGWYRLSQNRSFEGRLRSAGFGKIDPDAWLVFITEDLRLSDVEGMQSLGYELDDEDLLLIAIFRINPAFVDEMESLGWTELRFDTMVELRVGDVDARFVRELEAAGVRNLDPETAAQLAIIGVTADYIREMSALGYSGLEPSEYLQLKVLDVDAEFIRDLDARGVKRLSPEELVRVRALDVDEILLERD